MKTTLDKVREQVKVTKKGRVSISLPSYQVNQFKNLLTYFMRESHPGHQPLEMMNTHSFIMYTAMSDIYKRYFLDINSLADVTLTLTRTQAYCFWWLTQHHEHTAYRLHSELSALYMNLHRSLLKLDR